MVSTQKMNKYHKMLKFLKKHGYEVKCVGSDWLNFAKENSNLITNSIWVDNFLHYNDSAPPQISTQNTYSQSKIRSTEKEFLVDIVLWTYDYAKKAPKHEDCLFSLRIDTLPNFALAEIDLAMRLCTIDIIEDSKIVEYERKIKEIECRLFMDFG